jgi:hypothetical protein
MNAIELQGRCDYWLNRFGMAEWIGLRPNSPLPRVRVLIRSRKKMDGNVGGCTWLAEECTAVIEILRGHGEETLVHEILHLALEGHTTYAEVKYSEMHERALNRLASGYLAIESFDPATALQPSPPSSPQ